MTISTRSRFILVVGLTAILTGCSRPQSSRPTAKWEARARAFFTAKEEQARHLVGLEQPTVEGEDPKEMAPEVWPYFEAGRLGDWEKATRLYDQMSPRSYQFAADVEDVDDRLSSMVWQTVNETYRFLAQCSVADSRCLLAYGEEVIKSVPPGGIYLCGSDPGRFVITGLCRDQPVGDPFFVVSPNQMPDGLFLRYLESMYGKTIQVPTPNDSQTACKDYLHDVQQRGREKKLKPGEQLSFTNDHPQLTGPRAVFEIIARLTQTFFEKNPQREFFVDFVNDGYPIEWMFPHLVPHGPTLRLHRQPMGELSKEIVARDRAYWAERVTSFLGGWIDEGTSVTEVCEFANQVYLRKDLSNFRGDKRFVATARGWHWQATHLGASAAWGHARVAMASVYAWRARHAKSSEEQQRMIAEADLAFRQAFALCPYPRETVYNFVNHLLASEQTEDALLVTAVAMKLNPDECLGLHQQVAGMASRTRR